MNGFSLENPFVPEYAALIKSTKTFTLTRGSNDYRVSMFLHAGAIFELRIHLCGLVSDVDIVPYADRLLVSGNAQPRIQLYQTDYHTNYSRGGGSLVWSDQPYGRFGRDVPAQIKPGTECVILEKGQEGDDYVIRYTIRNIKGNPSDQASQYYRNTTYNGYPVNHSYSSGVNSSGIYTAPHQMCDKQHVDLNQSISASTFTNTNINMFSMDPSLTFSELIYQSNSTIPLKDITRDGFCSREPTKNTYIYDTVTMPQASSFDRVSSSTYPYACVNQRPCALHTPHSYSDPRTEPSLTMPMAGPEYVPAPFNAKSSPWGMNDPSVIPMPNLNPHATLDNSCSAHPYPQSVQNYGPFESQCIQETVPVLFSLPASATQQPHISHSAPVVECILHAGHSSVLSDLNNTNAQSERVQRSFPPSEQFEPSHGTQPPRNIAATVTNGAFWDTDIPSTSNIIHPLVVPSIPTDISLPPGPNIPTTIPAHVGASPSVSVIHHAEEASSLSSSSKNTITSFIKERDNDIYPHGPEESAGVPAHIGAASSVSVISRSREAISGSSSSSKTTLTTIEEEKNGAIKFHHGWDIIRAIPAHNGAGSSMSVIHHAKEASSESSSLSKTALTRSIEEEREDGSKVNDNAEITIFPLRSGSVGSVVNEVRNGSSFKKEVRFSLPAVDHIINAGNNDSPSLTIGGSSSTVSGTGVDSIIRGIDAENEHTEVEPRLEGVGIFPTIQRIGRSIYTNIVTSSESAVAFGQQTVTRTSSQGLNAIAGNAITDHLEAAETSASKMSITEGTLSSGESLQISESTRPIVILPVNTQEVTSNVNVPRLIGREDSPAVVDGSINDLQDDVSVARVDTTSSQAIENVIQTVSEALTDTADKLQQQQSVETRSSESIIVDSSLSQVEVRFNSSSSAIGSTSTAVQVNETVHSGSIEKTAWTSTTQTASKVVEVVGETESHHQRNSSFVIIESSDLSPVNVVMSVPTTGSSSSSTTIQAAIQETSISLENKGSTVLSESDLNEMQSLLTDVSHAALTPPSVVSNNTPTPGPPLTSPAVSNRPIPIPHTSQDDLLPAYTNITLDQSAKTDSLVLVNTTNSQSDNLDFSSQSRSELVIGHEAGALGEEAVAEDVTSSSTSDLGSQQKRRPPLIRQISSFSDFVELDFEELSERDIISLSDSSDASGSGQGQGKLPSMIKVDTESSTITQEHRSDSSDMSIVQLESAKTQSELPATTTEYQSDIQTGGLYGQCLEDCCYFKGERSVDIIYEAEHQIAQSSSGISRSITDVQLNHDQIVETVSIKEGTDSNPVLLENSSVDNIKERSTSLCENAVTEHDEHATQAQVTTGSYLPLTDKGGVVSVGSSQGITGVKDVSETAAAAEPCGKITNVEVPFADDETVNDYKEVSATIIQLETNSKLITPYHDDTSLGPSSNTSQTNTESEAADLTSTGQVTGASRIYQEEVVDINLNTSLDSVSHIAGDDTEILTMPRTGITEELIPTSILAEATDIRNSVAGFDVSPQHVTSSSKINEEKKPVIRTVVQETEVSVGSNKVENSTDDGNKVPSSLESCSETTLIPSEVSQINVNPTPSASNSTEISRDSIGTTGTVKQFDQNRIPLGTPNRKIFIMSSPSVATLATINATASLGSFETVLPVNKELPMSQLTSKPSNGSEINLIVPEETHTGAVQAFTQYSDSTLTVDLQDDKTVDIETATTPSEAGSRPISVHFPDSRTVTLTTLIEDEDIDTILDSKSGRITSTAEDVHSPTPSKAGDVTTPATTYPSSPPFSKITDRQLVLPSLETSPSIPWTPTTDIQSTPDQKSEAIQDVKEETEVSVSQGFPSNEGSNSNRWPQFNLSTSQGASGAYPGLTSDNNNNTTRTNRTQHAPYLVSWADDKARYLAELSRYPVSFIQARVTIKSFNLDHRMLPLLVVVLRNDKSSSIISSTQAGFNTLTPSSSYDINTQVPPYTPVVVPDTPQPSMSFTDSSSSYQSSVSSIPSTTKVRFILIGVLTFLSGFLVLPMVIKKLCNRDRRRRMTIRLARKSSDPDFHRNQPSSPGSFLVGDKFVEGGLSPGSVTVGEKRLSNVHSAGLAGIGINKLNYIRYNHHAFSQPGDENHMNSNFDNPYGTPTYMIGQGFAISLSYAAHLPRKIPRALELPSLTDNLGNAQYHGQAISKPCPVPLKKARVISPAPPRTRLRPGVSSWLKNGSLPSSAVNYSNSQSPSVISTAKSSERSMVNNNFYDTHHHQPSKSPLSPPALMTYPYHNQSSLNGNSVMDDTKRNGCMIFLKDSPAAAPVSLNNLVTERAAPCKICPPSPASSATRTPPSARLLFPNAKMKKAPGIAF
ncbi:hypothetical protein Clacol_002199 [Clathrus columnatus]|uniref:Uncharacterized protein n=1 Tax=Clathrus columnatus TaxID=1419009 RepID=A0AAV5A3G9_9AGAM|nr:hypothetical protein Clacol_002199 [Clathrus columnatus]